MPVVQLVNNVPVQRCWLPSTSVSTDIEKIPSIASMAKERRVFNGDLLNVLEEACVLIC